MNKHRQELAVWQQPVKQEKNNETQITKTEYKSINYDKF